MIPIIAVIGGSGFIGTRLVEELIEEKAGNIVIIDKVESKKFPDRSRIADVRDVEALKTALDGCDIIYNLAAEHRDDIRPTSLYNDVNVKGAHNICLAADAHAINTIIFTSTVAVYGLQAPLDQAAITENATIKPFNPYGESKASAEKIFENWQKALPQRRKLAIIRPTVVFGPGNRGNVHNLIHQIIRNRFIMVGRGENYKSIAFLDNLVGFLMHNLNIATGIYIYNYADAPTPKMNDFITLLYKKLGKNRSSIHLPYTFGHLLGRLCDICASVLGIKLPISRVRIEKFCATTHYSNDKALSTGFEPPYTLDQAIEATVESDFKA